jgi:hypothetical protein
MLTNDCLTGDVHGYHLGADMALIAGTVENKIT